MHMAKEREASGGSMQALARWMTSVDVGQLPEQVVRQAKLIVLDTLGCGIAGQHEDVSASIVTLMNDVGGNEQCTVVGQPRKTSVLNAVLANGCFIRVLDLNDYIGGVAGGGPEIGGHPSDNVPVALAMAEAQGRSGADALASIVLGYEVFGRLKGLMDPVGIWDEVTASGLVGAAIAGWLMKLDDNRLAHGLALGAARAATPAIVRGGHISAAKSIANALVAQSGAQGAMLAAHGVTGPLAILEAQRGLRDLFAKGDAAEVLSASLSEEPYILRSHIKMYPCLATGQSAVAAGLKIHAEMHGAVEGLDRIEVIMADYPIVRRQQQDPARIRPQSREAADHSFNFLTAVSLIDGAFGLKQYENERWFDPKVMALMERLVMKTDPEWAVRAPGSYPCAIRAWEKDGREHSADVPFPPGFARGGLSEQAVIEKFHAITADTISRTKRDRILAAVLELDRAASLTELMATLRP
jgi:2-methylcitrate dehydratase